MKMRDTTLLLHAAADHYGDDVIIRRVVLAPTHVVIDVTERWRHPPQLRPMESTMRKRPEHQGSRRVGPPIPLHKDRRGFIEPLTWALIGIAYMTAAFWLIVYNASRVVDERWF